MTMFASAYSKHAFNTLKELFTVEGLYFLEISFIAT